MTTYSNYQRNQLYQMLHSQEIRLQDNEYDIERAKRKLTELKAERTELESGIASTKKTIEEIESKEGE